MPRSVAEHLDPAFAPKRILSLDGGGTKGIIEIAFLERIESLLASRTTNPGEFRLCHYFDLIGGTSTGAIIATALALGMTATEVKALYFRLAQKIFRKPWFGIPGFAPRFHARGLGKVLLEVLGERPLESEDLKTGLAIIAKRLDTGSPWVLTNNPRSKFWNDPDRDAATGKVLHIGNRHYRVREVLRASTAARRCSFFRAWRKAPTASLPRLHARNSTPSFAPSYRCPTRSMSAISARENRSRTTGGSRAPRSAWSQRRSWLRAVRSRATVSRATTSTPGSEPS
jgi:hypothetical protein